MPKPKFYITFSNDEFEYYVRAAFVWTEAGLDDLHVQFNGGGDDNYVPTRKDGRFVVPINGTNRYFKGMEIWAAPPKEAKRLSPKALKSFWLKI